MLRRRIFASAMASVMAISSVAVIASADETVEAVEAAKNVKSQDELKKLVADNEAMRNDGIYDYGSVSGQHFLDALEYADNVLDDTASTASDYTVAYKMIEETKAALHIYSAEDLKALVDGCKKIYESDNIMNEELGDLIYDSDSFDVFAAAYDDAERALNSTDTRIITDAYDVLADAKGNLKALPTVTKAQFRAVLKSYEAISQKTKDYDGWRRGSFTEGWVNLNSGNYWIVMPGADYNKVTFAGLLNYVYGDGGYHTTGCSWCAPVVNVGNDHKWIEANNWDGSYVFENTVEDFVNAQYKKFDDIKTSNKTTNDDIVKAYQAAEDAVALFNAWSADDTTRATKSSVKKLLDQYHNQLVAVYQTTAAEQLYTALTGNAPDAGWTASASLKNDGNKQSIRTDDDNYWNVETTTKDVSVAKRVDILKYIKVTSDDVDDNSRLAKAMRIAERYLNERYSDTVWGIDTTGNINTANGSVAEWTLVYRYLKYALEDAFPAADDTTYTRADVKALINDCYDLADLTGDSAIFDTPVAYHTSMVKARQLALDWLRDANADKTYKEGDSVNGWTASQMYTYLEGFYKKLSEEFDKYKYSYGEIYTYISDVSEMIDDEEIVAKDELVKALKDTAYCLSVVKAYDEDNNCAFTSDREFKAHNRLYTYVKDGEHQGTASEKALMEAYEALQAAVKAQTEATAVLGDVNGDGVVTAADASEILKAVVGLRDAIANEVGDYNNDGAVTAADAAAILKAVIGL